MLPNEHSLSSATSIFSVIQMPSSPSSSSTEPTEGRESLPGLDAAEVVPPEISISPPNSCLDATQSEAAVDSDRRLFVLRVDLKDGAILEAVIHNENAFNPRVRVKYESLFETFIELYLSWFSQM